MQRNSVISGTNSPFSTMVQYFYELFTPKRIGLATAGAFVFAGIAAIARPADTAAPALHTALYQSQKSSTLAATSAQTASQINQTSSSNSVSTSVMSSSSNGNPGSTHVSVNGQDIQLPQNGSLEQTVANADGTTTVVRASQGNTTSSNSFSLNVHTSSSSGGDSQ